MDRKAIIILVVSFVLLLFWYPLINRIYPPKPVPVSTGVASSGTNQMTSATNVVQLSSAPTNQPASRAQTPMTAAPEELVVAENADARYTFTSHGGGLKLVELKRYPESVSCRDRKKTAPANLASLNTAAPFPVLTITGPDAVEGDGIFKLSATANLVRAEKTLPNGVTIIKEFRLQSNYVVSATVRLENHSAQPLNLSTQEWVVGTATLMGPQDDGTSLGVFWYDGKRADHVTTPWFENKPMGCGCLPGTPREQYVAGQSNVNWAAVHNQFFALAVMPPTNVTASHITVRKITLPPVRTIQDTNALAGTNVAGRAWLFMEADLADAASLAHKLRNPPDSLSRYLQDRLSVETRRLLNEYPGSGAVSESLLKALVANLNRILAGPSVYEANTDLLARIALREEVRRLVEQSLWGEHLIQLNRLVLEAAYTRELRRSPMGYRASLVYPPMTLAAGETLAREFHIYAGPKEYKTLARLGTQFQNNVDAVMEYGGFFGWFAQLLLLSMNGLHSLGLGYGLAIIAITIIIKLVFWPLTNASTKSMKRMQALSPQMKAIQEKFKDDPQKMQRKMWEFYKEHKINPAAGCLPVLVQMPIFIGFYQMIRSAIELRGARFLWNCDLSRPDTLFIIPMVNFPFNLLPLLMGVTMLWQARLTPASPGMDPMQQKIMKYMPLMFLAILYNFSAGLTLYWTVQNLLSIAQMRLTRTQAQPATPVVKAPMPAPATKKKK